MESQPLKGNDSFYLTDHLRVDGNVFKDDLKAVHCSQCSIHLRPTGIDELENLQNLWKLERPKQKRIKEFYQAQDRLIQNFQDSLRTDSELMRIEIIDGSNKVKNAAKLSFILNLILFTAKLIAAVLSGSFSILSSVVDSAVDLISGIVIWYTNRAIKLTNIYRYPLGRNRLEPLSVLVLSCVMAMASVLVIRESLGSIVSGSIKIDLSLPTIIIIAVTIVAKFFLYLYCRSISSPSTKLLALDHRNDVVSNSLALLFGALGDYVWNYMDPIGAVLLSLYVFASWWREGSVQIRSLSGHVAPDWLLKTITWICLQHTTKITGIDTVNASSIGANYLVEVHIVLPPETSLTEAHDIGESLQLKLEGHEYIERAFVHVDYDSLHDPLTEHRPTIPSMTTERRSTIGSTSSQ